MLPEPAPSPRYQTGRINVPRLIALTFFLATVSARSQTLNGSSFTDSTVVDGSGDALDNTFIFQIGSFDAGFEPVESNSGDWAATWRVLGTADDACNGRGCFTGVQQVQDVPPYTTLFLGLKAYLWIRKSAITGYFLARSAPVLRVNRDMSPALDPGCFPNGEAPTMSVRDLDTPVWGSQEVYQGGGEFTSPGPDDIQTLTVPESGSTMLALLGGGILLLLRRRPRA